MWATVRLEHLQEVFSAGKGRSSVEAWYSTSIDIEEAISGVVDDDVHIFVDDVVKSFDTVDRFILDSVLSSLGLPGWFRHAYFEYHARVRIRFKLATGLGDPWTRDGGIPQGCPLSMMFIVAFFLPWCLGLAEMDCVFPQLCADNLKCVSSTVGVSLLLLGLLVGFFVSLVRRLPLANVFFSALALKQGFA